MASREIFLVIFCLCIVCSIASSSTTTTTTGKSMTTSASRTTTKPTTTAKTTSTATTTKTTSTTTKASTILTSSTTSKSTTKTTTTSGAATVSGTCTPRGPRVPAAGSSCTYNAKCGFTTYGGRPAVTIISLTNLQQCIDIAGQYALKCFVWDESILHCSLYTGSETVTNTSQAGLDSGVIDNVSGTCSRNQPYASGCNPHGAGVAASTPSNCVYNVTCGMTFKNTPDLSVLAPDLQECVNIAGMSGSLGMVYDESGICFYYYPGNSPGAMVAESGDDAGILQNPGCGAS